MWAYWFSAVMGNAAIVTGVVGYVEGFSSTLASSELYRFLLAQVLLWGLCIINVLGIKLSARVQVSVLFLNIVPLLLFSIVALFYFDAANLTPFAPRGWGSLVTGVALIVWAYSGIESATVPAEEIRGSPNTIRHATLIGYAVGTAAFLLGAFAVAGVVPNAELATSARPIALAAERTIGTWAATIIGVAAIVAGLGTLNGWILMTGRIPVSAARDGIFFPALGRLHPRYGTPHVEPDRRDDHRQPLARSVLHRHDAGRLRHDRPAVGADDAAAAPLHGGGRVDAPPSRRRGAGGRTHAHAGRRDHRVRVRALVDVRHWPGDHTLGVSGDSRRDSAVHLVQDTCGRGIAECGLRIAYQP